VHELRPTLTTRRRSSRLATPTWGARRPAGR